MIASKHKHPQFPFNKYEVTIQFILLAIMAVLGINKLYYICQQHYIEISPSYFGNRNSHDFQWEAFRTNFPLMVLIAITWRYLGNRNNPGLLGIMLVTFMFRADVIFYMAVILISYYFSISLYKHRKFQLMKWIFVVSTISIIEYFNRIQKISQYMETFVPFEFLKSSNSVLSWASIINMSLLKMLSFGVDLHRAHFKKQHLEKHYQKCKNCIVKSPCLKARDMFPPEKPTLANYLNYILFPGTLLAGPPITYNAFHSFKRAPINCASPILRFILLYLSFEVVQYLFFVVKPHERMSLVDLCLVSLLMLAFIWYKFNIIWKWGRIWSYIEGIEVVDNMNRCVFNNYGFEGFWRMWHRGFNMWLIRYMYVPLGGNKSILKSYFFVFLFVAFWHDPQLKLLIWASVILVFIIPEILVKRIVRQKFSHLYPKYWFKYLSSIAGAFYVFLMCISNIVGFGFGLDGAGMVLQKMQDEWVLAVELLVWVAVVINLQFFFRFIQKDDHGY